MASPLKGLPQALSCTNQTYSSSNVRKIAYVIRHARRRALQPRRCRGVGARALLGRGTRMPGFVYLAPIAFGSSFNSMPSGAAAGKSRRYGPLNRALRFF
jgi:hypothetical protein